MEIAQPCLLSGDNVKDTQSAIGSLKCSIAIHSNGLFSRNTACTTMNPAMASHQMRAHLSTRICCPLITLAANRARGRKKDRLLHPQSWPRLDPLHTCAKHINGPIQRRASSLKPSLPPSASRQHHRPHGLRQITATQRYTACSASPTPKTRPRPSCAVTVCRCCVAVFLPPSLPLLPLLPPIFALHDVAHQVGPTSTAAVPHSLIPLPRPARMRTTNTTNQPPLPRLQTPPQ
jgi:hypothetical protein